VRVPAGSEVCSSSKAGATGWAVTSFTELGPRAPYAVSRLAFEDRLHSLRGFSLKFGHDVAVGVHRQCDLRVP
jgi:hypothetical protein